MSDMSSESPRKKRALSDRSAAPVSSAAAADPVADDVSSSSSLSPPSSPLTNGTNGVHSNTNGVDVGVPSSSESTSSSSSSHMPPPSAPPTSDSHTKANGTNGVAMVDDGGERNKNLNRKRKRQEMSDEKQIRVYADGIFDMFHFGHARMLEQCKNLFPNVYLLVGLCDDELTHKMKGKTVMNELERAESLRHCRHVDEVVEHAPWVITKEFLDEHRIDYVAHDEAPYSAPTGEDDVYAYVKSVGKFAPTQRTDGISTSDLINRVIVDYDAFVRRNLQRGYSRQDMNVGFLKEQRLKALNKYDELKSSVDKAGNMVRQKSDEMVEESKEVFKVWLDNSSKFMDDFLKLFGKRGTLNRLMKETAKEFDKGFKNFAQRAPM